MKVIKTNVYSKDEVLMLKKLWKNYSYAIILVVLSLVSCVCMFKISLPSSSENYMKITVKRR